jgi:hypothetical protein
MQILIIADRIPVENEILELVVGKLCGSHEYSLVTLEEANYTFCTANLVIYYGATESSNFERGLEFCRELNLPTIGILRLHRILNREEIEPFDHLYTENLHLLLPLQNLMGTGYVHFLPPLVYFLPMQTVSISSGGPRELKAFLNFGTAFESERWKRVRIFHPIDEVYDSLTGLIQELQSAKAIVTDNSLILHLAQHLEIASVESLIEDPLSALTPTQLRLTAFQSSFSQILSFVQSRNRSLVLQPVLIMQQIREYIRSVHHLELEEGLSPAIIPTVADMIGYLITKTFRSRFVEQIRKVLKERPRTLETVLRSVMMEYEQEQRRPSINLSYANECHLESFHRWGWEGVLTELKRFTSPFGVFMDPFLDKTFCWDLKSISELGLLPYDLPWIGFIHHPFGITFSRNTADTIFKSPQFLASLPVCRGLICLSDYLRNECQRRITATGYQVPVVNLKHPAACLGPVFSLDRWKATGYKVVQIGEWLRNTFSIYALELPSIYTKCILKRPGFPQYTPPMTFSLSRTVITNYRDEENRWLMYCYRYLLERDFLQTELGISAPDGFNLTVNLEAAPIPEPTSYEDRLQNWLAARFQSVKWISRLEDPDYDLFLAESVLFLDLIDCSASNAIVEAIMNEVPLLTRRIPATVEYLGTDYPLYFDSLSAVGELLREEKMEAVQSTLRALKPSISVQQFLVNFQTTILPLLR